MPVVCVCLFSAWLCVVFCPLRVNVCIAECYPSRPRVTPRCDPAARPQWDLFLAGALTVCVCVVHVYFAWNKMREWTSVLA